MEAQFSLQAVLVRVGFHHGRVGAPGSNKDEFNAAMDAFVVGEGKLFATNDLISKGRELFPLFRNNMEV